MGVSTVVIVGADCAALAQEPTPSASPTGASNGMPMFRGNPARTVVTPGPGPQRASVAVWCFRTGLDAISTSAVADEAVFVGGSNGSIYAIEAATGQEIWSVSTKGPIVGSPAVDAGVVYVPSTDGLLYAFDTASGQPIWTAAIKGFANSSPSVPPPS